MADQSDNPQTEKIDGSLKVLSVAMGQAQADMVESCSRLAQELGFPRSVGEIYGLLYFSAKPLGFDDIAGALSLSKASVSTGTRQLLALSFIRKVWLRGERKDYFEAVTDPSELGRRAYEEIFKSRIEHAEVHLGRMIDNLSADRDTLKPEEFTVVQDRLKRLMKLQKRIRLVLPLVERLFR